MWKHVQSSIRCNQGQGSYIVPIYVDHDGCDYGYYEYNRSTRREFAFNVHALYHIYTTASQTVPWVIGTIADGAWWLGHISVISMPISPWSCKDTDGDVDILPFTISEILSELGMKYPHHRLFLLDYPEDLAVT